MYLNSDHDTVEVMEPLSIISTGSLMRPKILFNRFSPFARWDEPVHITQSHVVSIQKPTYELKQFYRKLRKFVKHVFNEQLADELEKDTEDLTKFFSKDTVSQDAIYAHFLGQLPFPKGPLN